MRKRLSLIMNDNLNILIEMSHVELAGGVLYTTERYAW